MANYPSLLYITFQKTTPAAPAVSRPRTVFVSSPDLTRPRLLLCCGPGRAPVNRGRAKSFSRAPAAGKSRTPALSKPRTVFVSSPDLARPRLLLCRGPGRAPVNRGRAKSFSRPRACGGQVAPTCGEQVAHRVCVFTRPRTPAAASLPWPGPGSCEPGPGKKLFPPARLRRASRAHLR